MLRHMKQYQRVAGFQPIAFLQQLKVLIGEALMPPHRAVAQLGLYTIWLQIQNTFEACPRHLIFFEFVEAVRHSQPRFGRQCLIHAQRLLVVTQSYIVLSPREGELRQSQQPHNRLFLVLRIFLCWLVEAALRQIEVALIQPNEPEHGEIDSSRHHLYLFREVEVFLRLSHEFIAFFFGRLAHRSAQMHSSQIVVDDYLGILVAEIPEGWFVQFVLFHVKEDLEALLR